MKAFTTSLLVLGIFWFGVSASTSLASEFFGPLSRQHMNADIEGPITYTTGAVTATTTTVSVPMPTSAPVTAGVPIRIKIPQLNVDAPVIPVGLTASGAMDAPHTITEVGWYSGSVRPGMIGTAVMDGHVAQIRGGIATQPGVFSRLNELHVGDVFQIVDDRGETISFVVRESRLFDPSSDTTALFTSADGKAHLNIITCDGSWDPIAASFSQRLVILADAQ